MGINKHPIMFVLLTFKDIEKIPVSVDAINTKKPIGPEIRRTRIQSSPSVIADNLV